MNTVLPLLFNNSIQENEYIPPNETSKYFLLVFEQMLWTLIAACGCNQCPQHLFKNQQDAEESK